MPFLPNEQDAALDGEQAELDSVHLTILLDGFRLRGVKSGCVVSASSPAAMTAEVSAGTISFDDGVSVVVASGTVVFSAGGSALRFDLVVADNAGVLSVVNGSAFYTTQYGPTLPTYTDKVVLGVVAIQPNTTTVVAANIEQTRVQLNFPTGVGVLDHGALAGLADDDHVLYHTDARALTWLGTRSTSDLSEGTNLYFTDERAQDAVFNAIADSASIDVTYNDAGNSFSLAVLAAGVDHGGLAGLADDDHTQYTQKATLTTIGDIYYASAISTPARLGVSIPAANVRNVLGLDNGDTVPTWKIALDGTAPTTSALGDAASAGTSLVFAHRDHAHGREAFASPTIALGTAAAAGVATTPMRSDATIVAFDVTVPTTIGVSDAAAAGVINFSARRDHQHGSPATFPATAHDILSAIHGDALAGAVVDGSIVIGNVTPKWSSLAISIPAANIVNALGVVNGELRPSWKSLMDATVATTQAFGDAAAAGTGVLLARITHKHAMPADPVPAHAADGDAHHATAHNLLSTPHGDTLTGTVVDGDIMIGNVTPKWSRLAISVPAANVRNVFGVDNGETRPSWKTALDGTDPANIAAAASPGTSLLFPHRDHVHAHPDLGDLHTGYLLASGARALAGDWVQSGVFGLWTAGSMRVGSSTAPINVTAGDLTAVRAVFGTDTSIPISVDLLVATNAARFTGAVSQTAIGSDRVDIGVATTPRIVFEDNASATVWLVDNSAGIFRWFTPGVVQAQIDTSGMAIRGYARVGSSSAPTNVTAGDLTATRIFVNNDSDFSLQFNGSNPRIRLNSNAFINYTRSSHKFEIDWTGITNGTVFNIFGGPSAQHFQLSSTRLDTSLSGAKQFYVFQPFISDPGITFTLDADIAAGDVSLTVGAGQGASAPVVPFNIRIDNEIIQVTARTTDTFTAITRARYGTTAAAHTATTNIGVLAGSDFRSFVADTFINATYGTGAISAFRFGTRLRVTTANASFDTLTGFTGIGLILDTGQANFQQVVAVDVMNLQPVSRTSNPTGTIATARGLRFVDSASGSYTLTEQVMIDIPILIKGAANIGIRNASSTVLTPSTAQILAAATALLANASVVRITCSGAVTSTAAPFIADGVDGQMLTIVNVDTADAFTISDQGTLAGSNLRLSAATIVLGPRDSITLMYSSDIGDWIQIGQTNVI